MARGARPRQRLYRTSSHVPPPQRCLLANQDAAECHIGFKKPARNAEDVNAELARLRREAAYPQ